MPNPFTRPKRAMASAPAETPYQRARQVWDDRMGLSIAHARNWRMIAFANLGLAAFLGAGWWAQSAQATVKPYVVEVSSWGQTQKITALDGVYRPRDAEIDPVVIKADWMRAYDLTTPKSAAFLNGWAEAHDPFKDVGRAATSVEVLSVAQRSDDSFDIQWRETRFLDGQKAGEQRWRALISLKLTPPANEAELMKNPLGIRIEDVSWTPDAA